MKARMESRHRSLAGTSLDASVPVAVVRAPAKTIGSARPMRVRRRSGMIGAGLVFLLPGIVIAMWSRASHYGGSLPPTLSGATMHGGEMQMREFKSQRDDKQPLGLANPGFEDEETDGRPKKWIMPDACLKAGYSVRMTDENPIEGRKCALIEGLAPTNPMIIGSLMQVVEAAPYRGKRIRVRAAIRTEVRGPGNQAQMWVRVDRPQPDGRPVTGFFDNMQNRPMTQAEWKYVATVGDVDEDAEKINVGVFLSGRGKVWVDDTSLEVVGQDVEPTSVRPSLGLYEISGSMDILPSVKAAQRMMEAEAKSSGATDALPSAQALQRMIDKLFPTKKGAAAAAARSSADPDIATILIPLPLGYRDQSPLNYELKVAPAAAAKGLEIYEDQPGNFVARVQLSKTECQRTVVLQFRSLVLAQPSDFSRVPEKALIPEAWPAAAQPWLAATWCVDHKHPKIREITNRIVRDTKDVRQIIRRVEQEASRRFQSAQGFVNNLTAVEALEKRGSCTSNANLVAALLRACGVPGRVLAGYPSRSGPLQTHYIVEAYVPGFGWFPIESSRLESPWPAAEQINVAIIYPENEEENRAGNRPAAAGGVPYLSLPEFGPGAEGLWTIGTIPGALGHDHVCKPIRTLKGSPEEWKTATSSSQARWKEWLLSKPQFSQEGVVHFGKAATPEANTVAELIANLWGGQSK